MSAPSASPAPRTGPRAEPPDAHSLGGHVRATAVLLVLTLLLSGFVYPLFVTAVAQAVDPYAANGSLLTYPNGTVAGSALVAQNLSAPYLFWERPSLTDWNTTLGADTPPGPTDPALQALLNETLQYMREDGGFAVNATLPIWWVAPSASDIDPDLVPQAVLVQVPRVANATNLTIPFLQNLVNQHIVQPILPDLGTAYVDVLELDLALLPLIGK